VKTQLERRLETGHKRALKQHADRFGEDDRYCFRIGDKENRRSNVMSQREDDNEKTRQGDQGRSGQSRKGDQGGHQSGQGGQGGQGGREGGGEGKGGGGGSGQRGGQGGSGGSRKK